MRPPRGPAVVVADLTRPDARFLPLTLLAETLRDLGFAPVGLVAPYLPYMRQDTRFQPGEGVTSRYFAAMVSTHFDWLVTVDPHLHRYRTLDEIYRIPSRVVHAAPRIAEWIAANVAAPVLIGPDSESAQWVAEVAGRIDAPFVVQDKVRRGDCDVAVSMPRLARWPTHTPVLVDDIVSSGRTMLAGVAHLVELGMPAPVCVGIHALFAGDSYTALQNAGVGRIATVNTVPHPSNAIDIGGDIAPAVAALLTPDAD